MQKALLLVAALCVATAVRADVYMHGMRGSNNRLNEANAERNNDARLFDSQNNNRGGYNVGDKTATAANTFNAAPTTVYTETDTTTAHQYPMVYYEGSVVQIEWTNQHGCGGNNVDDPTLQNCNMVLQYACDNDVSTDPNSGNNDPAITVALRDGQNTGTITENNANPAAAAEGIHESVRWYYECKTRNRNRGLFTADQNLNGQDARFTRQNPNGDRSGLECPEERDYYPYWLPTPWIDIAYLTDRLDFCPRPNVDRAGSKGYIVDNSENVSNRYKCLPKIDTSKTPAQQAAQEKLQLSSTNAESCNSNAGVWISHTWGAPAPACLQAQWSRSNHLGNGRDLGTQMANFNWTLPTVAQLSGMGMKAYDNIFYKCVLRLRYNISTDDYDMWNINSTSNGDASPVRQNQQVNVGTDLGMYDLQSLQMSINTNQFGRTFQDRSHTFFIRARPANIPATAEVINLNVRGKRGNIVQTYPAMEYDFQANRLHVTSGRTFVHVQWTGSNTHNNGGGGGDGQAGDAGEGTGGTDRHNFVQMANLLENYPLPLDYQSADHLFANTECWKLDGTAIGTYSRGNLNLDCAVWMATSGYFRTVGSVTGAANGNDGLNPTLDNAPPSLIGGVVLRVNRPGTYAYMSTRNNNFSNRSQKGVLIVDAASTSA